MISPEWEILFMAIKKPPDRPAFFNLSLVAKACFIGRSRDISMCWGLIKQKPHQNSLHPKIYSMQMFLLRITLCCNEKRNLHKLIIYGRVIRGVINPVRVASRAG